MSIGITTAAVYFPMLRLQRSAIAAANAWFDSSLKGLANGERTMCNWDEDTVTMAAEAGRCALLGEAVDALYMASTTLPFADRSSAALVAEALGLPRQLRTAELAGCRRAGTGALSAGIDFGIAGAGRRALVVASERSLTRVGSAQEMLCGDAAAALVIGGGPVIAEYVDSLTETQDFVDQYRIEGQTGVYQWEERWIRDEGYLKIVPGAVGSLLKRQGVAPADVHHFILGSALPGLVPAVAKKIGIPASAVIEPLESQVGFCGAAHPLVLLVSALERAKPGELILLTSFGQGCDALLLRATPNILRWRPEHSVTRALATGVRETNYNKFQTFMGVLDRDLGKRAEADRPTRPTSLHRNREFLHALQAKVCRRCGTVQLTPGHYCINDECGIGGDYDVRSLAGDRGTVKTWTADRLTFDWSPPAYIGTVAFDGGGQLFMDFTDVCLDELNVGTKVSFHLRVKDIDLQRGFRRYFWKATPLRAPRES